MSIAGRPTKLKCVGCDEAISTADQIGGAQVNAGAGAGAVWMVCRVCALKQLALDTEDDAAAFVTHAKMTECAIAIACGLDLDDAVDWEMGDWSYGIEDFFRAKGDFRPIIEHVLTRIRLTLDHVRASEDALILEPLAELLTFVEREIDALLDAPRDVVVKRLERLRAELDRRCELH